MRKIRLYIRFNRIPIVLAVIAIACWFFIPKGISSFRAQLIATVLGVGISISVAESYKKFIEHRRVKKTFGYLKLITVPYIVNQSENISATVNQYNDICSLDQAMAFAVLVSNFGDISNDFDKSWLQLVYSQDLVDAIKSDDQFNKISHAVKEVLLFTKLLTAQSVIAKNLLVIDPRKYSDKNIEKYQEQARKIRDDLKEGISKLNEYTKNLDTEIDTFFSKNGAKYEEFDR